MSNLTKHAKRELEIAGLFDKDSDNDGMLGKAVMELMEVFSKQGHSGFSASIVSSLFLKVADYKPLTPLKGTANEWGTEAGDRQNNRCSAVFNNGDGTFNYLNGLSFKTQTGSSWQGSAIDKNKKVVRSSQPVYFPFVPKTFVIDVTEVEVKPDDWEFYINDQKQLEEALQYFEPETGDKGIV